MSMADSKLIFQIQMAELDFPPLVLGLVSTLLPSYFSFPAPRQMASAPSFLP